MPTATISPTFVQDFRAWRLQSGHAFALVSAQGAQVLEYGFAGEPSIIWNNPHANFTRGQPIRGGVPICWPWFTTLDSNPQPVRNDWPGANQPFHGLVRQVDWSPEHLHTTARNARLTLRAPVDTHGLTARLHITLEQAALELRLEISNAGPRAITMAAALHSYYAVSDVRDVMLHGFAGADYQDNLLDRAVFRQTCEPRISGLIERMYQGLGKRLVIEDVAWQRRIVMEPRNSHSAVLWNPGEERAASLDQFDPQAWPGMLCIETTRVLDDMLTVESGGQADMGVRISREMLGTD
ncbi:Aldose 1-epimerase [Pseudomonas sp. XWY-1]|uniref:D-hexose-6-phosphate mutarotase n=1 Tax=Pseudomonas TaxID=286 RepID=UPI000CDC1E9A|nr:MULTISPECIES: D-hexose-6-phosphate mutarotase [Pseudomonas]AUZ58571.1 Aldose 1-epimerase [Pseudomonas sp. XWY-1]UVL87068.1 D-hexose-6-phosphate mutarotase [Pseudomonas sichuanensis]